MKRARGICTLGLALALAAVGCGGIASNPPQEPLPAESASSPAPEGAAIGGATVVESGAPIAQAVQGCEVGLEKELARCAQAGSAEETRACLAKQQKPAASCYAASPQAKGLDCVFKNFSPFWDDCKMPCFWKYNMPWMAAMSPNHPPELSWGTSYLDCLGICANEYFNKRCSGSEQ